jgi:hypothetical protein
MLAQNIFAVFRFFPSTLPKPLQKIPILVGSNPKGMSDGAKSMKNYLICIEDD